MEPPRLPSDLRQYWIAVRYQLKQYLRSSRFYVFFGLMAAAGAIILGIVAWKGDHSSTSQFLVNWISLLAGLLVWMLAIVFGGDAASEDLGTPAGLYVLPLPVRRSTLLLGRISAAFLAATACALAFVAFVTAATAYTHGGFPYGAFGLSVGLTVLTLAGMLTFVVFWSALVPRPAYGFILGFVFLFIVLNIVPTLLNTYLGVPQYWSITNASSIATLPFNLRGPIGASVPTYAEGLATLWGYLVGFAAAAVAIFHIQEAGS